MRCPTPQDSQASQDAAAPVGELQDVQQQRALLDFSSSWDRIVMKTLCVISLVLVTCFQLVAADCRSSCGSISIKYPFGTDDGCGNRDYRLKCTGDGLELRLNNTASIFNVRKIDYDRRSISFSKAPMSSGTCPLEDLPTGMQISLCNSNSNSSGQVLCMSSNNSCCVERAQDSQPCPLYRQRATVGSTSSSSQLADTSWSTGALSFVWNSPLQKNCSDCQSSKGMCGYNSTNSFICICARTNTTNQCPDCLNGSCKTTKKPIILSGSLAIAVIVVVLFFGVSLSIYWKWKKNGREEEKQEPIFSVEDPKQQAANLRELLSSRRGDPARVFTVAEMEKATNGFAKERKLGTGGFGTVYKGVFDDGSVMAIKKANHTSKHSSQHFYNEVTILSQVNHRNLVRLIGCCIETDVPMLAYDYIPNGTLFEHLHRRPGTLSWNNRLRIAIETAEALAYLHSAALPPIYHRDVKTSNILLDNNYVAKVADFGLSRLVPVDATHVSTMVQGTPGYVDPEYYQTYQLTDKSDVYSFGVVLLEMVTGQKPVDFARASRDVNLSAFSVPLIKKGMLEDLIDPKLEAIGDLELMKSIKGVANVAVLCLSFFREDRPTMKQVLEELLAIRGSSRLGQVPSDHWLEGELIMVNSYNPSGGISYNSMSSNSVRDENSTELTPR